MIYKQNPIQYFYTFYTLRGCIHKQSTGKIIFPIQILEKVDLSFSLSLETYYNIGLP